MTSSSRVSYVKINFWSYSISSKFRWPKDQKKAGKVQKKPGVNRVKKHSSSHSQTLWLFLQIIWEHFGVWIFWSRDLMFPWQPSFGRQFYPNFVFSAYFQFSKDFRFLRRVPSKIFTVFASWYCFRLFQIKFGDFLNTVLRWRIQDDGSKMADIFKVWRYFEVIWYHDCHQNKHVWMPYTPHKFTCFRSHFSFTPSSPRSLSIGYLPSFTIPFIASSGFTGFHRFLSRNLLFLSTNQRDY